MNHDYFTSDVRVRYAPSPTGFNHSGGIRTALYNYLFAKQQGGMFLVRIEDTDQKRFVPGAEDYIRKSLQWCGIIPDSSPWDNILDDPMRQSQRIDIYQTYVQKLLDSGHAYYAFDSEEELKSKLEGSYNYESRLLFKNSLSLTDAEVQDYLDSGNPYVIRFKIPEYVDVTVTDKLRGDITFSTTIMDDKVLIKSDGIPTYHFASVVDDHLMEITHVMRGDEWLSSFPFHKLLYDAFGWKMPEFIHLSTILNPDGKGKLSKRNAAAKGFEIFPLACTTVDEKDKEVSFVGFKDKGYESIAYVNFLALLGHGFSKDVLTMPEMIDEFDFSKIHHNPPIFDTNKIDFINKSHLNRITAADIWLKAKLPYKILNTHQMLAAVNSIKPRLTTILDVPEFIYPFLYHEKTRDISDDSINKLLVVIYAETQYGTFNTDIDNVTLWIKNTGIDKKDLREVVSSSKSGSDLATIINVIGKTEFINRINKYIK